MAEKRTETMTMRVSIQEAEQILQAAKLHELTVSNYMRCRIIGHLEEIKEKRLPLNGTPKMVVR